MGSARRERRIRAAGGVALIGTRARRGAFKIMEQQGGPINISGDDKTGGSHGRLREAGGPSRMRLAWGCSGAHPCIGARRCGESIGEPFRRHGSWDLLVVSFGQLPPEMRGNSQWRSTRYISGAQGTMVGRIRENRRAGMKIKALATNHCPWPSSRLGITLTRNSVLSGHSLPESRD